MATQQLTDWADGDRLSAAHLQEAVDMLRELSGTTGAGATEVLRFPFGTSMYTPETPPPPPGVFWVRISDDEPAGGVYKGGVVTFPSTPIDTSSAVSLGGVQGVEEIVIINLYEVFAGSGAGHTLTEDPVTSVDFLATWYPAVTTDDPPRRIALIGGLSFEDCAESTDINGGTY